jgi:hypothetical protein
MRERHRVQGNVIRQLMTWCRDSMLNRVYCCILFRTGSTRLQECTYTEIFGENIQPTQSTINRNIRSPPPPPPPGRHKPEDHDLQYKYAYISFCHPSKMKMCKLCTKLYKFTKKSHKVQKLLNG